MKFFERIKNLFSPVSPHATPNSTASDTYHLYCGIADTPPRINVLSVRYGSYSAPLIFCAPKSPQRKMTRELTKCVHSGRFFCDAVYPSIARVTGPRRLQSAGFAGTAAFAVEDADSAACLTVDVVLVEDDVSRYWREPRVEILGAGVLRNGARGNAARSITVIFCGHDTIRKPKSVVELNKRKTRVRKERKEWRKTGNSGSTTRMTKKMVSPLLGAPSRHRWMRARCSGCKVGTALSWRFAVIRHN